MAHGYCNYSRTLKNATRNRQDLNYDWSFYSQASSKNLSMPLSVARLPEVGSFGPKRLKEGQTGKTPFQWEKSSAMPHPPPQYLKYDLGNNSDPLAPCIQFHGASKWN